MGPVDLRAYDGAAAGDPRLPAAIERLAAVVEPAVTAAEDRAGVAFLPGRDAVAILADSGPPATGDVNVRLVDGVRRPVIRVPVPALLSGEFVPEAHFASLLVEAAVIASAGDRVAPAWLRAGLGPEITGTSERVLHERALGGPVIRTGATALFPPTPANDDPLRAAARVRALERIARGERALARFVSARMEGRSEAEALDLVGVQDIAFLEAATETERDRALAGLEAGGPLEALAAIRTALEQGDPGRATAEAAQVERELAAGGMSPWVETDARLTLAQHGLVVGNVVAARRRVGEALASGRYLVRLREARLCEARAARATGDLPAAYALYRAFLADFPEGEGSDEALEALGIDPALNARLPGLAAEMISEDPKDRGRAAVRLGETGDPAVAEPLRRLTADPDADVRRLAYAALALTAGEEAVDDLDAGTRDPDPAVRGASLSLLSFADGKRGVARAREMESDAAPEVQTVVDRVLGPVREEEAREAAERARKERAEQDAREKARLERERREAAEKASRERAAARENERAAREGAERTPPPTPPQPRPPKPLPKSDPKPAPVVPGTRPPVKNTPPEVPGTKEKPATDTPKKDPPPETKRDVPLPPPRPPRPLPKPDPKPDDDS
jgi:hypothetical protein